MLSTILKKTFSIFFLFTIGIKSQFIQSVNLMDFDYSDNIQTFFPLGSLGFDTKANPYNPNLSKNFSGFYIQVSAIINIRQSLGVNDRETFKGKMNFFPNLILKFQKNWFSFQLSYLNSLISYMEKKNDEWSFNNNSNVYNTKLKIPAGNSILQFSSSAELNEEFSFTAGILTNYFITEFESGNESIYKLYAGYFDNFQFLTGINYNNENFIKA